MTYKMSSENDQDFLKSPELHENVSNSLSDEKSVDKASNDHEDNLSNEEYCKLKSLALKLKEMVLELTEQNKQIQTENQRLKNENDEQRSKVLRLSESAKFLHTIQAQYDQSQDTIEELRNENKQLLKKSENLVSVNNGLNDALTKQKQDAIQQMTLISSLTELKGTLQTRVDELEKKYKEKINELKAESVIRLQRTKDLEDMKNLLEIEKQAHKAVLTKLEGMKHEKTNSNVLSLEVANYEKSLDTIKAQLDEETNLRIKLQEATNEHLETIKTLSAKISDLEANCLAKSNQIATLGDNNHSLESNLDQLKSDSTKFQKEKDKLSREIRRLETCKKDLESKVDLLKSEIAKAGEENRSRIRTYQNHVDELKRESSRLSLALENGKREVCSLKGEFEGYKLRAQSVLLKTKMTSCNDTEEEVEHLRRDNGLLREKLSAHEEKAESLTREIILLRDERSRAQSIEQEMMTKLGLLRKEMSSLMEKCKNQEKEMQKLQLLHDQKVNEIKQIYEDDAINIKKRYEDEIFRLKEELNATQKETALVSIVIPSPPLVEREECEGSESTESNQMATKQIESNTKRNVSCEPSLATLTPLDQLLDSPIEEYEGIHKSTPTCKDLQAYKSRVKHLTELLADAERDNAKLTQLNQLLKEDIRLQKRYVKREEEAVNFEYLKNVVFKFITLENRDERSRLVPVLDTILKLTPEETHKLNSIVSDAENGGINRRSWWSNN